MCMDGLKCLVANDNRMFGLHKVAGEMSQISVDIEARTVAFGRRQSI